MPLPSFDEQVQAWRERNMRKPNAVLRQNSENFFMAIVYGGPFMYYAVHRLKPLKGLAILSAYIGGSALGSSMYNDVLQEKIRRQKQR